MIMKFFSCTYLLLHSLNHDEIREGKGSWDGGDGRLMPNPIRKRVEGFEYLK